MVSSLVQYIVVRSDLLHKLGWSLGAVVAQGSHASLTAVHAFALHTATSDYLEASDRMHTVVLGAKDEQELLQLAKSLTEANIDYRLWTEQPENIATSLATRPYVKSEVQTQMDQSNNALREYLPGCRSYVELNQPDSMSEMELKELFEIRGFKLLVSQTKSLFSLVTLYYDHLMPLPPHDLRPHSPSTSPSNGGSKFDRKESVVESRRPSITPPNNSRDDSLDRLVITNDPKRFTPGLVKKTKSPPPNHPSSSPNQNSDTPATHLQNGHCKRSTSELSLSSADQEGPAGGKRIKLNRNFSSIISSSP